MTAAPVTLARLDRARQNGVAVKTVQVLDVVERLHQAAEHPDITGIRRYGRDTEPGGQSPAGVALKYRSGSEAYLWATTPGKGPVEAAELPAADGEVQFRARVFPALRLLVGLLDVAKPAEFRAWRTVGFPGVGLAPCALEIRCTDGGTAYLRVTSGFGGRADLDVDEFPDYRIPEGVKTCLHAANAVSAVPA